MSTPSSDRFVRPRGASDAPSPSGRKAGVAATSTGGLDVERRTGSIGAVLHGLDLSVQLAGRDVELTGSRRAMSVIDDTPESVTR
jgi:hypothetical protein